VRDTKLAAGAARAVARLAKQVEVAIGPLDLSLPQYRVLGLLADGSTASSVLARQLAVSPPSVTAVVDGLVGRGLVERRADPADRRRLTLLLTRDGKRLLVAADAAAESRLEEIGGHLDDDRDAATAALVRWNDALDRSREQRVKETGR
jgi:DNA-binding MarR family transcriptional regulator